MLDTQIIRKTLRVPAVDGPSGDGAMVARQLDGALLSVGFKASRQLLEHLSAHDPNTVIDTAVRVLAAVRELVGDHVQHNVYFKDFPLNVPTTVEFWLERLSAALVDGRGEDAPAVLMLGGINLLALPGYGTYQHSYAEMLAAHDELLPSVKDRVTVLHLGGTLDAEAHELYTALAGSRIPLNEEDQHLLGVLAAWCVDGIQPDAIPVRENRALINRVRLAHDKPLLVDTVTDVLRLACALSGGDVSLQEPTRFQSLPRAARRALLAALDGVIAANRVKLGDVPAHEEAWKRLGERLHPHEYPHFPNAQDVFLVARRVMTARSLVGRVEMEFATGHVGDAVALLANAPGMLFRSLDRLLRASDQSDVDLVLKTVRAVIGKVSGRVILSVHEHLQNRNDPTVARIFANRKGRAWVTPDERGPLDPIVVAELTDVLDEELLRRLPACDRLVVDPAVLTLAVPQSDKAKADGFGVMPRGSIVPVDAEVLRFFIYWKQTLERTDFDLSALLLDDEFEAAGWLSYTSLSGFGGMHSGDITSAPNGASEFIDLQLDKVTARYIVPQINVYSGEGFEEVEESFFGFMHRTLDQKGKPFEARTVRMKSEMRGKGRVALPLVFMRDDAGGWSAKWLHLYLNGSANFNQVETNRLSTALLARSIVERRYLPVSHLVDLMRRKASSFAPYAAGMALDGPVTYVGIDRPEDLPDGSTVITLDRLNELVPA